MSGRGDFVERLDRLRSLLAPCALCPRACGVDRPAGERGFCGAGPQAVVASAGPHFGEESCLVGRGGSGAIFLAGCNLGCVFCQNYDISHQVVGEEMPAAALVRLMRALEARGCENINLVTPTHVTGALAEAIVEARAAGLSVPIVWNSSAYESVEVLRLLGGLVEIYMPDFKFSRAESAERYCSAGDYGDRARAAVTEMYRQVGDLVVEEGVARRGLLVRHLVMPGGAAESREILTFLASLSPRTFVNVMGQYRPAGEVRGAAASGVFAAMARRPAPDEILDARRHALTLGLRLDKRP
jgi:putative pyruvate formate lyase activating enzyme